MTRLVMITVILTAVAMVSAQTPLNPNTLTKYMDALPVPGSMPQVAPNYYEIGMYQIQQQLHSQLPPTTVWGYGTSQMTASYPAATIEAQRGTPIQIKWTNNLPSPHLFSSSIDRSLMLADWTGAGVPTVVHLHGGETEPQSDGTPYQWFTANFAEKGGDWVKEVFTYHNTQEPATLWYHDHALGVTRLNVYAGLAGFYLLRDPLVENSMNLPTGPYEVPIVIQDRMFNTDGSLAYPTVGINPTIHPQWIPEFFGDVILVNGKVWPYLNVEQRKYRFRFLNGSSARFYEMRLIDPITKLPGPAFNQIGGDGGYLPAPVVLNDPAIAKAPRLLLAPGERADVIIDFSAVPVGTRLLLDNSAKAPYPKGAAPDPKSVGQLMQFRVMAATDPDNSSITANHQPLVNPTPERTRTMTLNEVMGMAGPLAMYLDGKRYETPATETPTLGTTELWEIVNTTADVHPIHLHLVQFQLLNRQSINMTKYMAAYTAANPVIPAEVTVPVPVAPYLQGLPIPPDPNEMGWKDTYRMNPGQVTRILVRFTPQDGESPFAFDATAFPGYVWHCHILEHEENDMMRPMRLVPATSEPLAKATDKSVLPQSFVLGQNYPNPFNPSTVISLGLPVSSEIKLEVFNVLGQVVATLHDGRLEAGEHRLTWDASSVSSGIYFYRLTADGYTQSRKMMLLK